MVVCASLSNSSNKKTIARFYSSFLTSCHFNVLQFSCLAISVSLLRVVWLLWLFRLLSIVIVIPYSSCFDFIRANSLQFLGLQLISGQVLPSSSFVSPDSKCLLSLWVHYIFFFLSTLTFLHLTPRSGLWFLFSRSLGLQMRSPSMILLWTILAEVLNGECTRMFFYLPSRLILEWFHKVLIKSVLCVHPP